MPDIVTRAVDIEGLSHFLDDASPDIDNNRAENAIRPFVVGRRDWLFSDTPGGATASARLYLPSTGSEGVSTGVSEDDNLERSNATAIEVSNVRRVAK